MYNFPKLLNCRICFSSEHLIGNIFLFSAWKLKRNWLKFRFLSIKSWMSYYLWHYMLLQQKTKPKVCSDSKESPGYHSMLKGQTDLRPEDETSLFRNHIKKTHAFFKLSYCSGDTTLSSECHRKKKKSIRNCWEQTAKQQVKNMSNSGPIVTLLCT